MEQVLRYKGDSLIPFGMGHWVNDIERAKIHDPTFRTDANT